MVRIHGHHLTDTFDSPCASSPCQLAGRVLLIFLFLGFVLQGNWSIFRVFVSIFGFGACIMVAVGFKARWSASFLVLLLSVFNVSPGDACVRAWSVGLCAKSQCARPEQHPTHARTQSRFLKIRTLC